MNVETRQCNHKNEHTLIRLKNEERIGNEIFLCVPLRLYERKISVTELVEVTNKMPSTGSGIVQSSQQKKIKRYEKTIINHLFSYKHLCQ